MQRFCVCISFLFFVKPSRKKRVIRETRKKIKGLSFVSRQSDGSVIEVRVLRARKCEVDNVEGVYLAHMLVKKQGFAHMFDFWNRTAQVECF